MSRNAADGESAREGLRLLVTVTFKPNQLRAHLLPIVALDEVEAITLVADEVGPPIQKVTTLTPPRWLVRVAGRAVAKLCFTVLIARRERPDWVIGFNLVPHGINAWVAGSLSGARTLYHQIGGPLEWEGGGWRSDNNVLGRLHREAPALERLLLAVVRRCTAVATMGENGRRSLIAKGLEPERVHPIPAAIDTDRFSPRNRAHRRYDVLTVGDLIDIKQTHVLLEAVAALHERGHQVSAAIVGRGPLEADLRARARELGIEQDVHFLGFRNDVEAVHACSGVFVLTSRHEGLSVALSEAMASGLPGVVTDVGDQRELVRDGWNGFLFDVGDSATLARRLEQLTIDEELRCAFGSRAAADAANVVGIDPVAARYRALLPR